MNAAIIITGIICVTVLFILFMILQYNKTLKILEADKTYKKYDDHQNLMQEGVSRNRWDLSYLPALSRIFYHADWKIILSVILLLFLAVFYAIFRDNSVLDLIKVNVGAIIGTLVGNGKR